MYCKTLMVLLALLALASGAIMPLGLTPQPDGRIVGGSPAAIGAHPWQVSLQRSGAHFCGGSLISRNLVVSAAHCLIKSTVTVANLRVRAGSNYRFFGGTLSAVSAYKVHEAYNSSAKMYDIALVRLKTKLKLGTNINTIPLASSTPQHGAAATCTGWGSTSYQGASSSTLLYINTRIVGRTECASSSYGYGGTIRATMLCAASSNKDACQGDSGGPLVSGGKLVGIVSWGRNCALPNYPGVYANVAELSAWVAQAQKTI
ncbi:trypsin alpha-3 [Drosophila novamexicana]|uniref:trypsin alpha-3 n=1 Tax=Drosophila novamexicana TaxID=47314 RepID=UPI0011E5E652|nr:trypsin alpha-3 [Drosophila novamexicana]